ncbi:MAG: OmpA family protein [Bacteroidaceae bacterium]|nr:OmpA family protein [Bacteroidales bacterium]MCF0187176.1 OmpA family protein [Bacteroidaceae bacterium]
MKKLITTTITILLCLCLPMHAQDSSAEVPDYGQLRTNTWSIYIQGGASWGVNVPYKNVNPSFGTNTAPLLGGGVNFNIRPWVRIGLNYSWSWIQREQRYGEIQDMKYPGTRPEYTNIPWTTEQGGLVYSDYRLNHHDIDLTAEFNIAEIWPQRKARWFNVYIGTGVGYMFRNGRVYDMSMGYAEYEDPNNYKNGLQVAENWSYGSWLYAKATRNNSNGFYIPANLNFEFDIHPSWTIGIKGQYDFIINPGDFNPKGIASAAITVRFNFAGHKHSHKARYNYVKAQAAQTENNLRNEIAALNQALDEARQNRGDECCENLKKAQAENEALQQRVTELEERLTRTVYAGIKIYFDYASKVVKNESVPELVKIAEVIKSHPDAEVEIVGEASADGSHAINQRLSEERVAEVVKILQDNGVSDKQITSTKAIGDTAGIRSPQGRRVTITVIGE